MIRNTVFVLVAMLLMTAMAVVAKAECVRDANKQLIYKIEEISSMTVLENHPLTVKVKVKGLVNSGGWSYPKLIQAGSPEKDTVLLHFIAKPPCKDAITTQALMPVEATKTVTFPETEECQRHPHIKVMAVTNEMKKPVFEKK